jgi:phage/plasmid-like protein (TIGR03299 family)
MANAFMAARRTFVSGALTNIEPGMDVFDAFWAAGLHGSVVEVPMYGQMEDGSHVRFGDHKGIARQYLDGSVQPYAVPGVGYQIVQDSEVGESIQQLLDAGIITSLTQVGSSKQGAQVFVIGRIGDAYEIAGDPHQRGVLFSWTHDGTGSIKAGASVERLHCTNQIPGIMSRSGSMIAIRHTASAKTRLESLTFAVAQAVKAMDAYDEAYERLVATRVGVGERNDFVERLFPISASLRSTPYDLLSRGEKRTLTMMENKRAAFFEALEGQPNANIAGTAAALAQAAVEVADHSPAFGSDARRGARVLTGGADAFKKQAFDLALALV